MAERTELDFDGAVAALQGVLGRHVSVTIGNFTVPHHPAFAGFAGVLGYAERPDEWQLEIIGAGDDEPVYTFFAGPDTPFDRSWFTLVKCHFVSGVRVAPARDERVDEQITITNQGGSIVVSVPTHEYLRGLGVEPKE